MYEVGKQVGEDLTSATLDSSSAVSVSDSIPDTSSRDGSSIESRLTRDMAADIHVLLDQLEADVYTAYDELRTASVAEDASDTLRLILQELFFSAHLWDDILTVYRYPVNVIDVKKR